MKDFYQILGVAEDASPRIIKHAFRKRARSTHPDISGEAAGEAFRTCCEAYSVLSDPERKRLYDLKRARRMGRNHNFFPSNSPRSPFFSSENFFFTDPFEAASRLSTAALRRNPRWDVELILNPREAMDGGDIPIPTATQEPCPVCHGTGGWFGNCEICGGRGTISRYHSVTINLPAGVADGQIILFSLPPPSAILRVRIRIAGWH